MVFPICAWRTAHGHQACNGIAADTPPPHEDGSGSVKAAGHGISPLRTARSRKRASPPALKADHYLWRKGPALHII
jgi:hypothetical protein